MTQEHAHSADALKRTYASISFATGSWPRLWWNESDSDAVREKAAMTKDFADNARAEANATIKDPAIFASEPAWHPSQQSAVFALARAAWFFQEPRLVSLATRLLDRAASAESWVAPEHAAMQHDHCASNVGATVAVSLDLLSGELTDDYIDRYITAVREKCLIPFLDTYRAQSEFWSKREYVGIWKLATCGDAGLAALGTLESTDADLSDILAYATEGVVSSLKATNSNDAAWHVGVRYLIALSRYFPEELERLGVAGLVHTPDFVGELAEPHSLLHDIE